MVVVIFFCICRCRMACRNIFIKMTTFSQCCGYMVALQWSQQWSLTHFQGELHSRSSWTTGINVLSLTSLWFFFGYKACKAHGFPAWSIPSWWSQLKAPAIEHIRSPFAMVGSSDPVSLPVGNTSPCSSARCVGEDDVPATVTLSLVAPINESVTTTQPPRIFVFISHSEFPFPFFSGSCSCLGAAAKVARTLFLRVSVPLRAHQGHRAAPARRSLVVLNASDLAKWACSFEVLVSCQASKGLPTRGFAFVCLPSSIFKTCHF